MSSGPPADAPAPAGTTADRIASRGRRGWSLRARLLAVLILLLAGLCVVIGLATEVALHQVLVGQIDTRLQAAGDRSVGGMRRPDEPGGGHRGAGPQFLLEPGQGAGTLGARVVDGTVAEAAYLPNTVGDPVPVPAQYRPVLAALPADGRPHTRDLGELGPYRLLARRDGGSREVVVTGLPLADTYAALYELAVVEVAVALAALIAAGLGGAAVIRRTLRPLRRVAATASRVAEMPLHRGDVALAERVPEVDTDPRTEVGQVGAALNRMLGHIDAALAARQASETKLRQFVADASHELRTPLAAIRGYAELGRRAPDRDSPGIAHLLDRVESQANRMTALVEDLLLLARLDAGRPLEHQPVDLSAHVVEAIGDAHVAGPEHRWRLDLPDEPVIVPGDGARLHQALANLLSNARVHTPAGTTVTVRLRAVQGYAELTVADDGPGIVADLLPQVFQRFARGDGSRSRAAGSTGLGLAIVDAVVEAHGGTVAVDSRPRHTVFTVRLPLSQPIHSSGTRSAQVGDQSSTHDDERTGDLAAQPDA